MSTNREPQVGDVEGVRESEVEKLADGIFVGLGRLREAIKTKDGRIESYLDYHLVQLLFSTDKLLSAIRAALATPIPSEVTGRIVRKVEREPMLVGEESNHLSAEVTTGEPGWTAERGNVAGVEVRAERVMALADEIVERLEMGRDHALDFLLDTLPKRIVAEMGRTSPPGGDGEGGWKCTCKTKEDVENCNDVEECSHRAALASRSTVDEEPK